MNIFSLNTKSRRVPGPSISPPEILYSCRSLAKPILHDTMLQVNILREIRVNNESNDLDSESFFLESIENYESSLERPAEKLDISGSIVTALKVSLTRSQYEQVLDTVQWMTSTPTLSDSHQVPGFKQPPVLSEISEEDTGKLFEYSLLSLLFRINYQQEFQLLIWILTSGLSCSLPIYHPHRTRANKV